MSIENARGAPDGLSMIEFLYSTALARWPRFQTAREAIRKPFRKQLLRERDMYASAAMNAICPNQKGQRKSCLR